MMACNLRLFGQSLDVDRIVSTTTLPIATAFRKGERRHAMRDELNDTSGLVIRISNADFYEFDRQIGDAIQFLETYRFELISLVTCTQVDIAFIDFGTGWLGEGAQFWRFPLALLTLIAEVGIELELSHYPVPCDD